MRTARPAAPEDLVRRLAAQATPMRRSQSRRFAMAGVATAVMLVGLAAIGGVGRAASELHHVVNVATGQTHSFGTHLTVQLDQQSAARAQYTPPTQTTGDTSKAQIPPGVESLIQLTGNSVTLTSDRPLFVSLSNSLQGLTSTASIVSASLANTFVTVHLTDANGNTVSSLTTPMSVAVALASTVNKNYAVTFSSDGVNFKAIGPCVDGKLPPNTDACYLPSSAVANSDRTSGSDSGPSVQILSLKPGIFGVVYKANITQSESGRTVPQAGSGKFGDPTRNHVGAPVLKQVGSKITPATSLQSTKVPFDFSVDEQSAVYISIYDAQGKPVMIRTTGTKVRGHAYSGKAVHTLHFVVLRPGQINTLLNVAPGTFKAGQTYKIRITAVDFDGHKVTEYTTFTG